MPNTALMIASSDEHFREMVRDSIVNLPDTKVVAEYTEIAPNLYIRVLQDLERHPHAGLVVDISGDPEGCIKAIEKVKQAAPDLFVMVSNFHADGETVIQCMRAGANEFLLQPIKRTEFRDAMGRLERAPRHGTGGGESKLGKIYTFIGTKGGVGTTTLATNFAAVLAQRKVATVALDLDWVGNDVAMQLGRPRSIRCSKWRRTWNAWTRRSSRASSRAIRWVSSWWVRPTRWSTTATSARACCVSSPPSWWKNTRQSWWMAAAPLTTNW